MSSRSQAIRLIGSCVAAGVFLGLAAQPKTPTTPPPFADSQNAGDNQKQVAGKPVSVEIPAVNYYARGGESNIELSPTPLMPSARGQGRVKALKQGDASVEVQFTGLTGTTKFGNEFLTYVLWGSVPQGRTLKIGELVLNGDRRQVVATTALHTFAMMVTAEPYAAVTQPSSLVILKGASPTSDTTQTASAHIELLAGAYAPPGYIYEPLDTSSGYAPELIQAMNARRIAKVLQAEKYAAQKFQAAEDLYQYMMGSAIQGKKPSKQLLGVAKAVAESYEEARAVSVRQQQNNK
jgi:hypothetical protein